MSKIREIITILKTAIYWGWTLRHNKDWDFSGFYEIMYYKLNRIYNCVVNDPYHFWSQKEIRNIARAREYAHRLAFEEENKFSMRFYDEHGWTNDNMSVGLGFKITDIPAKTHVALSKLAWKRDEEYRKHLKSELFKILRTHGDSWWT